MRNLLKRFIPTLPVDRRRVQDFKLGFQGSFVAQPFVYSCVLGAVFNSQDSRIHRAFIHRLRRSLCTVHPRFSARQGMRTCFTNGGSRRDLGVGRKLCDLVDSILFMSSQSRPRLCRPHVYIRGSFVFGRLDKGRRRTFGRLCGRCCCRHRGRF